MYSKINKWTKCLRVFANVLRLERLCVKLLCVNLWLSASVGRAGLLPSCRLEFLYWLFESALSRSLPTQSCLHQRSPKSVTQIWHCITRSAPWHDMYIMCNIVHIYSHDYPQSINTLIYSGEKIEPQITLSLFGGFCMENVSIKCRCVFITILFIYRSFFSM